MVPYLLILTIFLSLPMQSSVFLEIREGHSCQCWSMYHFLGSVHVAELHQVVMAYCVLPCAAMLNCNWSLNNEKRLHSYEHQGVVRANSERIESLAGQLARVFL